MWSLNLELHHRQRYDLSADWRGSILYAITTCFQWKRKKSIISTMWPLDSHKREWASTNNHLSTFINYIPYISLLKHLWWLSPIISSGMSLAPLSLVAGCKCWGAESLNHRFFRPTSSACSIFSCTCRIMTIPKIFGSTTPYNQPRPGFEHCSLHFRKK
jgi:hypothetical protein